MNANAADHEGLIEAIQDGNEVQWLAARDAAIRADIAAEVLREAAVAMEAKRLGNPMNGDGSNYMLDKALKALDVLAGNDGPTIAAAWERARRDDEADAYAVEHYGQQRRGTTHTEQLRQRLAALSAANDNGATSPHETAPNAAQGNLASLAGTSATKEATWDEVGGSMWLDRHQWGVIIDGLVLQRAEALTRKAANEYSNSDERAEMCVDLIRRINAADSLALSTAKEATT